MPPSFCGYARWRSAGFPGLEKGVREMKWNDFNEDWLRPGSVVEVTVPNLGACLREIGRLRQLHKSGDAQDAARYRFLRDGEYAESVLLNLREAGIHRDDVDAAVDAAMNAPHKPG